MIVIGIDIGLTGAIGMLDWRGDAIKISDMPVMQRQGKAAYVKNQVNAAGLEELLRDWTSTYDRNEIHVVIETPIAFPGQHVATTAAAFLTAGLVEGVVAARHYPHSLIAPKDWKKALGLSDSKEQARARAIRLFPRLADELKRVKDHNRAEALLIAKYGWDKLS